VSFSNADMLRYYDEVLVPRLFRPWAELLIEKSGIELGDSVLDVATGPGTVAEIAAERVGPTGKVTAADISNPMLEIARSKASPRNAAPIAYVESPASPLTVESGLFDGAYCQHGLQYFPDRRAGLLEMHRALRPGGWLAVAVWDRFPAPLN